MPTSSFALYPTQFKNTAVAKVFREGLVLRQCIETNNFDEYCNPVIPWNDDGTCSIRMFKTVAQSWQFVWGVVCGSKQSAALHCFLLTSRRRIKTLNQTQTCRYFYRKGRGVRITHPGEVFPPGLREKILALQKSQTGRWSRPSERLWYARIGALNLRYESLPTILIKFSSTFPNVETAIYNGTGLQLLRHMHRID